MVCVKCGCELPAGAVFCPRCGEKAGGPGPETPLYQADVKTLLKSGRLLVYQDRTEFVSSSVQKSIFHYAGLVSVKKNLASGIDFITEDGRTETCPADKRCVHEALVHIEQASGRYLAQRKERLLSQGIRYSFPSSQGFLNDGVLNLSDRQAEFRAKSGKSEVIPYEEVKSVSAGGGTLDFILFGGGVRSYTVSRELREEAAAFAAASVAPFLARRKEALLARGIYFSSSGPDGGTLDILEDRAEYRNRTGQVTGCVSFPDIRAAELYGGTLELALTDGTVSSFPIEEDLAAGALDFIQRAIGPYVAARTVGFDTAFGVDEQIEFNDERGVFHLIRQGGREITAEHALADLNRCEWTEDRKLTALGSVVSGGIGLFRSAAKAGQPGGEPEEKIGSVDVVLTLPDGQETVCFGRSPIGMSRTDKKFDQCLEAWEGLAEYLRARCPDCALAEPPAPPVLPEPAESAPEAECAPPEAESPEEPPRREEAGVARYIEGVARFIGNCATPMTIAFQGNRGSGRASTLGSLFDRLEGKNRFWLSARQLPKGESGEALTALVGNTLTGLLSGDAAKQTGSFLTGLAGIATGIIAGDTAIGKELADGVLNKGAAGEDPVIAFSKRVEARTRGGEKLVFFLDGLQQLPAARAVELLEAMRDCFACRGCVFVVSVNYGDILRGARERYDEERAQRFFDGTFNMAFRVPEASFDVGDYAGARLEDLGVRDGEELALCTALIERSVGRNAEAIDRLFTSAQLLRDMTGGEVFRERYKRLALFALLCMQARFRDAYDAAVRQRDRVTPEFLAELCQGRDEDYRDFGGVLARVVNLDGRAEISEEECRAFAEALELSSITSR